MESALLEDRLKRTLTQTEGKDLSISLPKEHIKELGWRKGQKLNVSIDEKRKCLILSKDLEETHEWARLELNSLELNLPKQHWNLYFVIATEHPENQGDMLLSVLPEERLIKVRRESDNKINFVPKGDHVEGMIVLEREIPADKSLSVHLWLMHSRKSVRKAGELIQELNETLTGTKVLKTVELPGSYLPWIAVGKVALSFVANRLKKAKDRDLGFVNLDENFNEQDKEELRHNALSTGFGKLSWTWIRL